MKANEQMIGDLVRVNRDGLCIRKNTIVEIRGVDGDNKFEGLVGCASCMPIDNRQLFGGIWCDYLEPIPLTAEILEKNGFVKSEMYEVWKIIHDDYEMIITPWRFAVIFLEDGADKVEFSIPRPNFVHELQHALRLCGIEKEIEL